jgi:hypothetical protein
MLAKERKIFFHLLVAVSFVCNHFIWASHLRFGGMIDLGYCRKNYTNVSYGLDTVLTFLWFNMLRSACMVGLKYCRCRQYLLLGHLEINNHEPKSSQFNMHFGWTLANSDMPLYWGPACFIVCSITQKKMQIKQKQVWLLFPFHKTVYLYQIVTTSAYPSVTVTLLMGLSPRLNITHFGSG